MAINRIKTGAITDATIQSGDIAPGTIANDRLAGSVANAKLANSAITINGTSIALGASGEIVAGTDWQAVTVADGSTTLTAEAGKGYFLDTNTGVIEVFLPTSPSRGDTVVLVDYAGTFATNNAIVNTGTNNLDSTTLREYKLASNDSIVELVYVDSAKGWITKILQAAGTTPGGVMNSFGGYDTISPFLSATGGTVTTSGDYKIHTFTGDGNFVVASAATAGNPSVVDYLVVAGGGSGGGDRGGGGGGGGFRFFADPSTNPQSGNPGSPLNAPAGITVSAQTYPITVGGGGAASSGGQQGNKGSDSVFSTITSTGGGFGGGCQGGTQPGGAGGSGGGGRDAASKPGGAGNTPPVSPPQGNSGGTSPGANQQAGGGGGAIATGEAGTSGDGEGGNGAGITGFGATNGECSSCKQYFSGGGSGGTNCGPARSGGLGGAGNSVTTTGGVGTAGTANTGGGSAGSNNNTNAGTAGGKGIVVLRYKFQ